MSNDNPVPACFGLASSRINAVKGALISFIVLGHLTVFSEQYPMAFNVLYNFHVAGFLFLSMLLASPRHSPSFVRDRVVRYLVPYGIFVLVTSLLYYTVYLHDGSFENFADWLWSFFVALIVGSEETLDRACGIRAYWFLPALLSTVLALYVYETGTQSIRCLLFIAAMIIHFFIGLVPQEVKQWIPFGLHIALFVFPLGLAIRFIVERFVEKGTVPFALVVTSSWLGCIYMGIRWNSYSAIAGGLDVPSLATPGKLLFHDFYAVSAFLSILSLSHVLARTGILSLIGRHSLMIFLIHTLVWQGFLRVHALDVLEQITLFRAPFMKTSAAFVLVIIACTAISMVLSKMPGISRYIFPRKHSEWPFIQRGM